MSERFPHVIQASSRGGPKRVPDLVQNKLGVLVLQFCSMWDVHMTSRGGTVRYDVIWHHLSLYDESHYGKERNMKVHGTSLIWDPEQSWDVGEN